ncbi:MAG: PorT family protein [Chitinophagaceae bacterium]|nr:PorT family protein [Chitinophagaceae bacterium]
MSNVNDNNLDDLLRRAAEKYPLRTDSADFAKLVADLEKDPSLILPPVVMEERRKRRRFFWLFLLLPLGGGAYFAWHTTSGRAHLTETAGGKQTSAPKAMTGDEKPGGESTEAGQTEDAGKSTEAGDDKIGDGGKTSDAGKSIGSAAHTTTGGDKVAGNGESRYTAGREARVTAGRERKQHDRNGQPDNIGRADKSGQADNIEQADKIGRAAKTQNNTGVATDNVDGVATVAAARQVDRKVSLATTKGTVNVNIPVKAGAAATTQQKTAQKDKTKLQKPKPSFYVGILGSPDLSTIKMQSVKSVGYNFGLLLGYSFNSRWSIETGLYYDRKKYYTDGEYFSKEKVPQLNNYNIKTADGFCNMWEIPLNVRYNFSRGDKIKWFATVGFSNYLMTGETYTFTGSTAWDPNWKKTWSYTTPYKYWFSILDFSVGFEQRLGKIGNLRLEPFVRVPLTGVGTGSLSIMSAGLNIGITRRIW